jgi:hypothetical protein
LIKIAGDSSLRTSWGLVLVVPFAAFAIACSYFGWLLWQGSPRARRPGTFVTVATGVLLTLLCAANLVLGVGARQPASLVGAGLCAAGIWLCIISFRLCRRAN